MKTADAGDVLTSVETDNFTHEEAAANGETGVCVWSMHTDEI